jgi:hypothetical protein
MDKSPSPEPTNGSPALVPQAEASAAGPSEPDKAALQEWEEEGGGLAPQPAQARAKRGGSVRTRQSRQDAIAELRASSAADRELAGQTASRQDRMDLEDSAARAQDRGDLLQRLSDSIDRREGLDDARRAHTAERAAARPALPDPAAEADAGADPPDRAIRKADVEHRLSLEARAFDASIGGAHKFNNVRRYSSPNGANWTANFGVRGGSLRLRDSVALDYMLEALHRVQAEMPDIEFEDRR